MAKNIRHDILRHARNALNLALTAFNHRTFAVFLFFWLAFGATTNINNLRAYNLQQIGVDAIVTHRTFSLGHSQHPLLQPMVHPTGDAFVHNEQILAAKQPGQFAFSAIPYTLLQAVGITYDRNYDLAAALVTWLSAGLLAALALAFLDRMMWRLWGFSRAASLAATLTIGLASTWLSYAGIAHHDVLATALIVLGLYAMESNRIEHNGNDTPRALIAGILLGLAIFASMLPALIVLVIGASVLRWKRRSLRVIGWHGLGFFVGILPLLAYNAWYFGSPLLPANVAGNYHDTFPSFNLDQFLHHLNAYVGTGGISLWKYAPGLALGMIGLALLPKRLATLQPMLLIALGLHVLYLLSISTTGTCSYGPRYLLPVLPLLAPGVAVLIDARHKLVTLPVKWSVIGALLAYGFLINIIGTVQGTIYCNQEEFALWGRIEGITTLTWGHFPLLGLTLLLAAVWAWRRFDGPTGAGASTGQHGAWGWALSRLGARPGAMVWEGNLAAPLLGLGLLGVLAYLLVNPRADGIYDYTFRIAEALLEGRLGLTEPPPILNEMIPVNGAYYSAFPLGSVLSLVPFAVLKKLLLIDSYPARSLAALTGGTIAILSFLLTFKYPMEPKRRLLLALLIPFGTWTWANLAMAAAWQQAIGFAMVGELGALYFTLVHRRPWVAGCFFALAFGNRTEIILLAPVFLYLVHHASATRPPSASRDWRPLVQFCAVPFVLGVLTLAYNYARFSSAFDFGYARIPGVLDEEWYRHGIFSLYAIPDNAMEMLFRPWKAIEGFPYYVPTGFGGSIFLSSPFLFLMFRRGGRDLSLRVSCWIAIAVLTLVLWCHGNPGGWQYSYRYAMILLPWMFLLLLDNGPKIMTRGETTLLIASIAINAYATYLFHLTDYVQG